MGFSSLVAVDRVLWVGCSWSAAASWSVVALGRWLRAGYSWSVAVGWSRLVVVGQSLWVG